MLGGLGRWGLPQRESYKIPTQSPCWGEPQTFPLIELGPSFLTILGYYEHEYVILSPYGSLNSLNHPKNYSQGVFILTT